jgi:hypothetical protein
MQKLASVLALLLPSGRPIGSLGMQKPFLIASQFRTSKGINHVVMLAFSPVVQGDCLQLMGVNDLLRHALRNSEEQV